MSRIAGEQLRQNILDLQQAATRNEDTVRTSERVNLANRSHRRVHPGCKEGSSSKRKRGGWKKERVSASGTAEGSESMSLREVLPKIPRTGAIKPGPQAYGCSSSVAVRTCLLDTEVLCLWRPHLQLLVGEGCSCCGCFSTPTPHSCLEDEGWMPPGAQLHPALGYE